MTASAESGLLTMMMIAGIVGAVIGIAVYVWYALALSRLFPRIDGEGWKGWVPILNEAEILARGGVPAWSVVFYFIPLVQFYGLYLKVVATHRINKRFGRGAGMTVLAILLPPVWATVLAWGAAPYPEGERLAALQPGPRRTPQPSAAPARDASGYTIPSLAPHLPASSEAPSAPAGPSIPGFVPVPRPQSSAAPDAPAPPSAWGAPSQPQTGGSPAASFAPPQAPAAAPFTPQPPAPQPPAPQPPAPQPPAPFTPQPQAQAPQPLAPQAPQFSAQPPAPHFAPPQPPESFTPPAPPTPQPPVPAPAVPVADSAPVAPSPAHPPTGIMAAMGGAPSAPVQASAHANAAPAPAPAEGPGPDPVPAAPADEANRTVRPVPPSFRDPADDVAPPAPSIRPAPGGYEAPTPESAPALAPPVAPAAAEAVPIAEPPLEPVVPAQPFAQPAAPSGGLADEVDKTVVSPRPTDDDLDATVVVARKRGVRRSLVLDDGRTFVLSGASVVIGRNPVGEPGEQRLAITDTTRTLSKTHARLVVTDDEWRLTDLHATNGVIVVADGGGEILLDPGESVVGNGRFILGEVGMHVVAERDS